MYFGFAVIETDPILGDVGGVAEDIKMPSIKPEVEQPGREQIGGEQPKTGREPGVPTALIPSDVVATTPLQVDTSPLGARPGVPGSRR